MNIEQKLIGFINARMAQIATVNVPVRMQEQSAAPRDLITVQPELRQATLFLYDELSDFWGVGPTDVRMAIESVSGPIDRLLVRINSPGGDVFDTTAMMTVLRSAPWPVDTQIDGGAFSGAGYLVQAGRTRSMVSGAVFGLHRPITGVMGNAARLRARATELEELERVVIQTYARRSGLSDDEVTGLITGEDEADGSFLSADRALLLNFVDEIIPLVDAPQIPAPQSAVAQAMIKDLPPWVRDKMMQPKEPENKKASRRAKSLLAKLNYIR